MKKQYPISLLMTFFYLVLAFSTITQAATAPALVNPIKANSLLEIIDRIINFLMIASVPLLIIFIILGAYNILTAGGVPAKFKTGKDIILYAVIGFTVILISKGIAAIVLSILGANS